MAHALAEGGLTLPKQALVFMCLQYKSFENTLGKREISRNEQFLLFPQCFLCISAIRACFNPLPDDKILEWSKLKQIADDILKCI